jgi:hypothetical protein
MSVSIAAIRPSSASSAIPAGPSSAFPPPSKPNGGCPISSPPSLDADAEDAFERACSAAADAVVSSAVCGSDRALFAAFPVPLCGPPEWRLAWRSIPPALGWPTANLLGEELSGVRGVSCPTVAVTAGSACGATRLTDVVTDRTVDRIGSLPVTASTVGRTWAVERSTTWRTAGSASPARSTDWLTGPGARCTTSSTGPAAALPGEANTPTTIARAAQDPARERMDAVGRDASISSRCPIWDG